MFVVVQLRDTLRILPKDFSKEFFQALTDEINAKYTGKVLPDHGLCVVVLDIVKALDAVVHVGLGSQWVRVEFREVVFRPLPEEIIAGKVAHSDYSGVMVSLGFFKDIHVPPHLMQEPSVFDEGCGLWIWQTTDEDGVSLQLPLLLGADVLFRVKEVVIERAEHCEAPDPASAAADDRRHHKDKAKAKADDSRPEQVKPPARCPMRVVGSFLGDGLGALSWWNG
eukprot:RCo010770